MHVSLINAQALLHLLQLLQGRLIGLSCHLGQHIAELVSCLAARAGMSTNASITTSQQRSSALAVKAEVDDGRAPAELPLLSTPGRCACAAHACRHASHPLNFKLLAWDDGRKEQRLAFVPDGALVEQAGRCQQVELRLPSCRVHLSTEAAAAVRSTSLARVVEELCLAAEAMYSTRGVEGGCC